MSSPVPFNDLSRGTASIRPEIDAAIARVLDSGWYVLGPEHNALEAELSEYMGVGDTVLVANGTDALQLGLTAIGVRPGSVVLTAANAGGYTSTAVRSLGGVSLYADVDPDTMLLSVADIESAVTRAGSLPDVVVVTHLFGAVADMTAIMEWADRHGVPVLEDGAQSIGALHTGRRAGSFGRVSTTSFYPTKNLGALGDGGAVFTSDADTATHLRSLRQYGWASKYRTTIPGGRNSRMDELQAAIVRVKLRSLDALTDRRREIHSVYEAAIGTGARLVNRAGDHFVGHLAVIETSDRERARQILAEAGVQTDVHYPIPDHLQPLTASTEQPSLPAVEAAAGTILSIPLFPELSDTEVARVAAAISRL